jgi:TIR domain/SIR2-like domain
MKNRHWNSLVESLRCGRCILVLGPEIAADWSESGRDGDAHPATFAGALTEWLAEELSEAIKDSSTVGSLAAVAQLYEDADKQGFGAAALHSQAAQFYASLRLKPSRDHQAIASLPFRLIVTTCHDQLLAAALTEADKTPLVFRYHFKGDTGDERENRTFPRATPKEPVLYHLFGTSQEAQTLVLSENDLLDFVVAMVSDRPPVPTWLRRELQTPEVSLLFVGFGISHWYQRVLVKALIRFLSGGSFKKDAAVHVALDPELQTVPDPERTQTIMFYERGNRVEISDQTVAAFVAELQQKLEKAGGLTERAAAVPRPKVFISYVRENDRLAAAVFEALTQAGLDPWMDTERLRGGEDWDERVREEIRGVDYVLVLVTPELVRATVGYVNTEITLALKRATAFRDRFVIPLMSDRLGPEERIPALSDLNETRFRERALPSDLAPLAKDLRRGWQLRNR